jgi:hypothetical protein
MSAARYLTFRKESVCQTGGGPVIFSTSHDRSPDRGRIPATKADGKGKGFPAFLSRAHTPPAAKDLTRPPLSGLASCERQQPAPAGEAMGPSLGLEPQGGGR